MSFLSALKTWKILYYILHRLYFCWTFGSSNCIYYFRAHSNINALYPSVKKDFITSFFYLYILFLQQQMYERIEMKELVQFQNSRIRYYIVFVLPWILFFKMRRFNFEFFWRGKFFVVFLTNISYNYEYWLTCCLSFNLWLIFDS